MKQLPQTLESNMKIRFHDCDPFNHLNNSRYIDYIMTARGDQILDNYHIDIYKLAREKGIGWVTAQTQIAYFAPATVMEEVVIQTRLLAFSDRSLSVEACMLNQDKSTIKTLMWVKLVHINILNGKPIAHPPDLIQIFEQVVMPLPIESNFEERAKVIKAKSI